MDYGWYWLGPLNILKSNKDKNKVSFYISTVIFAKFFLSILLFFLLIIVYFFWHKSINYESTFLLSFLMYFVGRSHNAQWIFMGLEKLIDYFFINLTIKIITIFIVFNVIKKSEDYIYINFILGFSELAISLVSYSFVFFLYKYKFLFISFNSILLELKDGYKTFLTNLAFTALINSNVIILSFFIKDKALIGVYSLVEKIINLVKFGIMVLIQAIYPTACKIYLQSLRKYNSLNRKLVVSFLLIAISICSVCFFLPDFVLSFFSKTKLNGAKELLQAMCLIPILSTLVQNHCSNLIIHNRKNIYTLSYLSGMFINITLIILLINNLKLYSVAVSGTITEAFIFLTLLFFTLKNKRLNFYLGR